MVSNVGLDLFPKATAVRKLVSVSQKAFPSRLMEHADCGPALVVVDVDHLSFFLLCGVDVQPPKPLCLEEPVGQLGSCPIC